MTVVIQQKNPGWLAALTGRMQTLSQKEIAVGFPKEKQAAYPDGEAVCDVAAQNVFGVGVPQRDFMALAKTFIPKRTAELLRAAVSAVNHQQPEVAEASMEAAGLEGAECIKDAILDGEWAPNSAETIKRKKSDKPLIDTAHMKNSATYVVRPRTT